jgi:hypothetical protein
MFINTVFFPMLKKEKDSEFRDWFVWTNQKYAKHNGFISRKLLNPTRNGTYAIIVEHESLERATMLNKAKTLKGYKLNSLNGEIGKVEEFYIKSLCQSFPRDHQAVPGIYG